MSRCTGVSQRESSSLPPLAALPLTAPFSTTPFVLQKWGAVTKEKLKITFFSCRFVDGGQRRASTHCISPFSQFNSIQFICIAHFHKLLICLRGLYNLYIETSLTFDLTSDQEKLPNNPSRGEKGKKPSGEDPSPGWTGAIDVMCTEGIITHKLKHCNNTINEYDRVYG